MSSALFIDTLTRPIGQRFFDGSVELEVVESKTASGVCNGVNYCDKEYRNCFYFGRCNVWPRYVRGLCSKARNDNKDVYFKEVTDEKQ